MRGAGIGTNSKIFPDKQFGNYRELYIFFKAALKRELSMKEIPISFGQASYYSLFTCLYQILP